MNNRPLYVFRSRIKGMCCSVWKTLDSFLITKMSWKPLSSVIIIVLLFLLFWGIYHFLPPYRFTKPVSTVVFDRNGELLGARIATDGQWRFPVSIAVPEKFKICLIEFEDHTITDIRGSIHSPLCGLLIKICGQEKL